MDGWQERATVRIGTDSWQERAIAYAWTRKAGKPLKRRRPLCMPLAARVMDKVGFKYGILSCPDADALERGRTAGERRFDEWTRNYYCRRNECL